MSASGSRPANRWEHGADSVPNRAEEHPRFDYTTVGHVTVDVLADGTRRPGGGAFYSALQAARLGQRTLILTQGNPAEVEELLAPHRKELEVEVLPARHTTTLATSGVGAQRRQRVLAWAGPIVEKLEVDTSILHLAAVARETPTRWRGRADFVGLTPQGLLREWGEDGEVTLTNLDPRTLPQHFDALVLSDRERAYCEQLFASHGPSVADAAIAVTAGSAPTEILLPSGTVERVPVAPRTEPRDDLGAGDVFAAAFFIALREGLPPEEAATYGHAAAAVRLAGVGAPAVGTRGPSPQRAVRTSARRGRSGRAGVLDGGDEDDILALVVYVDEQQPAPGAKEEAEGVPAPRQFAPEAREALERAQRALDANSGVGGETVGEDQAVEILERGGAQPDLGHRLEFVQRDRLARQAALQPELSTLIRTRDAIEQRGDVARVGIGFLDRRREQRAREGPLLHVCALRQLRQASSVLAVEHHVQPVSSGIHTSTLLHT